MSYAKVFGPDFYGQRFRDFDAETPWVDVRGNEDQESLLGFPMTRNTQLR